MVSKKLGEYDGEQHFIPVKNWGGYKSFNELKERDALKDNFCYINKIKLFRISYIDNIEIEMYKILLLTNG